MRLRTVGRIVVSAGLRFGLSLGIAHAVSTPARAATFTVTNTNDSGPGSLRDAIESANLQLGFDRIQFRFRAPGVQTFTPHRPLPPLTDQVSIEGTRRNNELEIELDGSAAGPNAVGLELRAQGSSLIYLIINRFSSAGVQLGGKGGHRVQDCFIGTDWSGTIERGNQVGVWIASTHNDVFANLISGNSWMGVYVGGGLNRVRGNSIGPDLFASNFTATGSTAQLDGVQLWSHENDVRHNLIAGARYGILFDLASRNFVLGNRIGANGNSTRLGDLKAGIFLENQSDGNVIGGFVPGEENQIAFVGWGGGGDGGVKVVGGIGNTIRGNRIHSIDAPLPAIDLVWPGNDAQWAPILDEAWSDGTNLVNAYALAFGSAGDQQVVDFYSTTVNPASGQCEARAYLGSVTTTINSWFGSSGFGIANLTQSAVPVQVGEYVGATGTTLALGPGSQFSVGSTSEFSACGLVQLAP